MLRLLSFVLLACLPTLAAAQAFPAKPVRLVIPYPPGGLVDVVARAIAADIAKIWSQPMVVENRPGGNQIIAAEHVARSPADGYTILALDKSGMVINPILYTKLPYDPAKDFVPVLNLMRTPTVLIVNPQVPANSLAELVRLAKAKPEEVTYGTFGAGSVTHIDTEAFSRQADIKLRHIPYKGIAEVLPAVASGQINIAMSGVPPMLPLAKQGRIKVFGSATTTRSAQLPDVPTFAEAGFPGFLSDAWFGIVAPAGTPRPIVEKLASDIGKIIAAPEFNNKYITGAGMELLNQPTEAFAEAVRTDAREYGARVRALNLKLD